MSTKVTIAIPTNRGVKPKTLGSLLDMVNYSSDFDFHVVIAENGYTVAENRNYAVIQAMKNESDYLFFCDDDMVFPAYTLNKLITSGKDIIGVASNSRTLPLSPTVGLMDENGNYMHPDTVPSWKLKLPNDLFTCYFVGGGVLLINMDVFNHIEKPYFAFDANEDGKVTRGEDGYFCDKAKEAGYKIWCDPTVDVKHIGDYLY